jgi:hypothetical protein
MTRQLPRREGPPEDDELGEVPRENRIVFGHAEGRRASRIAWIGIALLLLAFVKPWAPFRGDEAPARPDAPIVVATAGPTPFVPPMEVPCVGGRWSVEADERWVGTVVRTWVLTDAVEASGPTDPAIRFVTVAAQQIISIGYCPPSGEAGGPDTRVTFFRLGVNVYEVPTTRFLMPPEAEAAANLLYRPMSARLVQPTTMVPPSWSAGRYVMRIDGADGYRRWLGVDVRLVLTDLLGSAPPTPSRPPATTPGN